MSWAEGQPVEASQIVPLAAHHPAEKLTKAAEAPSKLVQRARLVQKPNKLK